MEEGTTEARILLLNFDVSVYQAKVYEIPVYVKFVVKEERYGNYIYIHSDSYVALTTP